jgi:hypothetical protein
MAVTAERPIPGKMDVGAGADGFVGGVTLLLSGLLSCSSSLLEAEKCRRLFHAKLEGWDRLERIRLLTLADRRHNIMVKKAKRSNIDLFVFSL